MSPLHIGWKGRSTNWSRERWWRECDDCAWRSWLGGAIGLIPWTVFLVITLPANYVALGFDVLLVAFMVATAVLIFLRRQLVLLTAFTTGVLLISDALFDVMTAGPHDLWESAATATLVELPLAVILIATALRILRLTVTPLPAH